MRELTRVLTRINMYNINILTAHTALYKFKTIYVQIINCENKYIFIYSKYCTYLNLYTYIIYFICFIISTYSKQNSFS